MKRPNFLWDGRARCFYYPSGALAVTDQEMYASIEAERKWCAIGFVAALAWLVWGETDWFLVGRRGAVRPTGSK